jgi:hypothetical protein
MPLSTITITGSWVNPDNTPASGIVSIQPIQEVTAAGTIVAGSPVHVPLVAGSISTVLVNNMQATALQYQVTERITNTALVTYTITPSGSALDLSTAPRGSGSTTPLYLLSSELGVANGVCPLDGGSPPHIPTQYLPTGSGVLSVTAGDATITIGGSGANPTVAVASIPESKVTGLVSDLAAITTSVTGKATRPIIRRARITSGDTTLPNTGAQWAAVSGFELQLPAAVGDDVEIGFAAMRNANANALLDIAVIVGSSLVRFLASGTSTPALEGEPDWYTQSAFIGHSADRGFTVTSGDLDGGVVRFVLACMSNGSGTVFSSVNYPFYWRAINRGSVG